MFSAAAQLRKAFAVPLLQKALSRYRSPPPWNDRKPVREELFGVERLEQHALSLAAAQPVTSRPHAVLSLQARLDANATVLLAAYRASALDLETGHNVVPAAEWLLDNYHLVEEQVREIREDLPPGYYRQLPKLRDGPFMGYPRVFGIAWAFVAHTDSNLDLEVLRRFIMAYQRVQPLTIGELWAIAITLRIVLIENLRRLADQITAGRRERADADALADRMIAAGASRSAQVWEAEGVPAAALSEVFAAQLAKRLRGHDPRTTPAVGWLEDRLRDQGVTIDEAVQHGQQRQGASNVSVRNVITTMRRISGIDWADFFESVSLVDERLRRTDGFVEMDFATRNLYRSRIEQLARRSPASEFEVADVVLTLTQASSPGTGKAGDAPATNDAGYHLIGKGHRALEHALAFRPTVLLRIRRFCARSGIVGYLAAILLLSVVLLMLAGWAIGATGLGAFWLVALALTALLPVSEMATALVNRAAAWMVSATMLPGLELAGGVPQSLRTLVVVPTLLSSESELLAQVEQLEVHHLSNVSGDLAFALLLDGADADREVHPADEPLLAAAVRAIADLNLRYGPAPGGSRFLLLYRRRLYNPAEDRWMGWERKRGKLHELNRLLRGAADTSFVAVGGAVPWVPENVRYVITLDADTRLPRDAARRLVGKMAHPLNRPRFNAAGDRVVEGYGILQPRVTSALPIGGGGSLYQQAFSAPGGIDPYSAAVSDVYQDLVGEGSYTGKGIYDVDAFERALRGRIPENALLSHDLFEGVFARAGLASDIEVVEEAPARYDVVGKRQHRWTRGDWQLLPWVLGRHPAGHGVPTLGRLKMLDNLRRSVLAPLTLTAVGLCWLLPPPAGAIGLLLILVALALPMVMPPLLSLLPRRAGVLFRSHLRTLAGDFRIAVVQIVLSVAFLPDQAWRMGDAIVRTLYRLSVSRRHLLEWTTAAQAARKPSLDLLGFQAEMAGGTALTLSMAAAGLALAPASWPLMLPLCALWVLAPVLALGASRQRRAARRRPVSVSDAAALRLTARRTWRFFETFLTAADNMLPPDNFQEDPRPVVAHRTSPTNIGLYLLAAVASRDFGWNGTTRTVERLEATFASLRKMPRFKGHFFNWYGTLDLQVLAPAYVSSVDSGNLAGHLIAVANACEEWTGAAVAPAARSGMADQVGLLREAVQALPSAADPRVRQLTALCDEMGLLVSGTQAVEVLGPTMKRLAAKTVKIAQAMLPADAEDDYADLLFWAEALERTVVEHAADRDQAAPQALAARLAALATTAREMALAMDFSFLLDPERRLLSIGYNHVDNSLDPSCYDLLASEARLASLFAIAKGDVPTRHWFRLGRAATPLGSGSALISWSGSMFEYLMPSLVMRAPLGSLLEQTNRLVVERQMSYGRALGIPWGISESAYNARDMELTYQYSNFGVPGLGLKRGLSENLVIAPYATGLAAMVDPLAARMNYRRLAQAGACGRYGFYEALDYTASRLPADEVVVIVRNFMAHHQGMTIVAIANALNDGRMRNRFHREPMIQACELLLQERMPRNVAIAHPRAEEVKASASEQPPAAPADRRLAASDVRAGTAPTTHLLSNGRYTVMLTATGSGFSNWREIAVTRWREDSTLDDWGSYVFVRDTRTGKVWTAAPGRGSRDARAGEEAAPDHAEVIFGEDRAEFIRRDGSLGTTLDVLVSGEDDGEVRRVTLTNSGRRSRELELTSYAEVVLATPAADSAHPAFAKLFVVTEYVAEYGALIATRRTRSPAEPTVWAAHFAVVEGDAVAEPQYESDRARFRGRSRVLRDAPVLTEGLPLSGTVGTVLDAVFSIRRRVAVPAGRTARVAFWTVVASSRSELLNLIDQHHDRSAFDRAKTLAWTQAQVQLRHLDIQALEAADFQQLAAPILYADPRFRAPSATILLGAGAQAGLWLHAISGDLPIVLLLIEDPEDVAQVHQLLRAHEYWRMKRLAVDLVIVNERAPSYVQDLQVAIETAVRSSQSRPRFGAELAQGTVHVLRGDFMTPHARDLLKSVARVTLVARRGTVSGQLAVLARREPHASNPGAGDRPAQLPRAVPVPRAVRVPAAEDLEYFNGLGGFDSDGREYVTVLESGARTPAPWINVISNEGFGFQVSADGAGYTWAGNSRENQLSPWSNDPVADPSGESIYIRDEQSGVLFSATAQPIRDEGIYVARHGYGYSRFEHEAHGIAVELLQFVPIADPIKISRLVLHNRSDLPRALSVTAFVEWVLGTSRGASAASIQTEMEIETGAMLARNPWSIVYGSRVAFADLGGMQSAWTGDRAEFIGRGGSHAAPFALSAARTLSNRTGAGLDPCSALQAFVDIDAGESVELVYFLGQCASVDAARDLVLRYRSANLDAVFGEVARHWQQILSVVQVRTPDRAMDIMLNGWLLYQTLACRIRARSAFYQASGAYGFRDQLQDGMALTFSRPEQTRRHLLLAASRQFVEGDVQHWWLPHSGQGVRTRISDDRVWLAFATATYVAVAGDAGILDEQVPFLEGPVLLPGHHDEFFQPSTAEAGGSLFEHCARGLDQSVELTGRLGLPLIGTGDWNDGMNRVGEAGRGESVWLGWLLLRTIELFAPLAEGRGDSADVARAARWRAHSVRLREAIEREAWDGEWYRRATYDDGTWLGSASSDECRIDSIAQSWAVLSGAADPARAAAAMLSVERHLVRHEEGLALLFAPPFDRTERDPGYIKGYPPGLRENGGQYSHAAMWAVLAFVKLGDGDRAGALFHLLNPINHARTPAEVERYKVEPYVVAADVYSVAPHAGRGGWTWYTGSAGWMYRAGTEGVLGIRREGHWLIVDPCIPSAWGGFEATVALGSSRCDIRVTAASPARTLPTATLDGQPVGCARGGVRVLLDGKAHVLLMSM